MERVNMDIISKARVPEATGILSDGGWHRSPRESRDISPHPRSEEPEVSPRFTSPFSRIGAVEGSLETAISFTQAQNSYLRKVGKALERMSDLASVSLFACRTDDDRGLYHQEFVKLQSFLRETAEKSFNGTALFGPASLAVAADEDGNMASLNGVNMSAPVYRDVGTSAVDSTPGATAALKAVRDALSQLSQDRAAVGANLAMLASFNAMVEAMHDGMPGSESQIDSADTAAQNADLAGTGIRGRAIAALAAQGNPSVQNATDLLQVDESMPHSSGAA